MIGATKLTPLPGKLTVLVILRNGNELKGINYDGLPNPSADT